nr:CocE/NonD family hydrolase [Motilibacter aurantiacus]
MFHANYFVARGYGALLMDMIGTNESTGCPTVHDESDNLSAKVVIDWLDGRARAYDAAGTRRFAPPPTTPATSRSRSGSCHCGPGGGHRGGPGRARPDLRRTATALVLGRESLVDFSLLPEDYVVKAGHRVAV